MAPGSGFALSGTGAISKPMESGQGCLYFYTVYAKVESEIPFCSLCSPQF